MISDEKFEEAKPYLYQESTITLLHETTSDKVEGIIKNGLNLAKSYNGEISRVVKFPKNDEEFKNYDYYMHRDLKTIVVLSIPKSVLGEISVPSFNGQLLLNCLSKKEEPVTPNESWIQYKPPAHQRLASTIPTKWINGFFDEANNFIQNPNYILRQENSQELIELSKKELKEEFKKRYPAQYSSVFPENDKVNLSDDEIEL